MFDKSAANNYQSGLITFQSGLITFPSALIFHRSSTKTFPTTHYKLRTTLKD
jgi:hypothetical protein